MDPLSITVSVIAVIQATSTVLSICYDYRSAIKNTPWALAKAIDEVRDLRNVLESLENLSKRLETQDLEVDTRLSTLKLLCSSDSGPLQACLLELNRLGTKLSSPTWINQLGRKRRALIQAIGWQVKDSEIRESLRILDRYKLSLNLAITADEAALLLDLKELSSDIHYSVKGLQEEFTTLRRDSQLAKLDERHRKMFEWLSPVNPELSHRVAIESHKQGTGDWIFRSQDILDWINETGSCLWLSGFPGAGKTILFATLAQWIQANLSEFIHGGLLAYFYCDFRKSESKDPVNIIGSLVAQLATQLNIFPDELEQAYEQSLSSNGQHTRPTVSILCTALETLAGTRRLILLVDALDECQSPGDLSQTLKSLASTKGNINVFVTSRDEPDISQVLSGSRRISLESHSSEISEDIRSYIGSRLQSENGLLWLSPSVKVDVQSSLNRGSGGMFRWVQCQLDQISKLKTVRSIRKALKELPQDLEQTYQVILSRISPHYVGQVVKILQWLSFTMTPLSLSELHDAITIDPDLDYLDDEARLSSPEDILDLCSSLVNLTDGGVVRLAHLSVKDYLLSKNIRQSPVAHFALETEQSMLELCIDCLAYLSIRDFRGGPATSSSSFEARRGNFPFLDHAAVSWPYYSRVAYQSDELHQRIIQFFDSRNHSQFMAWVQVLNYRPVQKISRNLSWDSYPRHATPLYYAASFGLLQIVRYLIAQGADLDAPGSRFGGTAVHAAVIRDHADVVTCLLEAGANADKADFNDLKPIHTALLHENDSMVSLLLQYGAKPASSELWFPHPPTSKRERQPIETKGPPIDRINSLVNDSSEIPSFQIESFYD